MCFLRRRGSVAFGFSSSGCNNVSNSNNNNVPHWLFLFRSLRRVLISRAFDMLQCLHWLKCLKYLRYLKCLKYLQYLKCLMCLQYLKCLKCRKCQ